MKLICKTLVAACAVAASIAAHALDHTTPEGGLQTLIKMRADLNGKDVYADWKVTAWAVVPNQRMRPLFRLDGFNVARMERQADGSWRMISREVAYYRDLRSGEILSTWQNPFTNQTNTVLQVVNDPVNLQFGPSTAPNFRRVTLIPEGEQLVLRQDVPLAYPNPITPREYPAESSGETYFASEHFTYYAKAADVANPALTSAPTHYGWTRIGPWLPWMKMGVAPGHILYIGHGSKLKGAEGLDPVVRADTEKNHPEFMFAPKQWSQPNETSWTWYRKQNPPAAAPAATPAAPAASK